MSAPKGQAENPSPGHRKSPATENPPQPVPPSMKCPRCDSPNTKFCYYNNYSLTQPRHFCKTCRRYWTKGGALRNVPVGGGCRKNKKLKLHPPHKDSLVSSSSSAAASSSAFMNLKLFHGLSSPAMDFQLHNSASAAAPLTGFDHSMQNLYPAPPHGGLASSIESLSSINQDLHWKLQQQRLAVLFGGHVNAQSHHQTAPVPIMFQNLEISKPSGDHQVVAASDQAGANNPMEWFFGINGAQTPTSSGSNGNDNVYGNVNDVQAWTTFRAGLP